MQKISDQYSLHITPLGFARETSCDNADEKFLLLFARKNYKAAEALSPFVSPSLFFEYLFYIWDLYRAREFILGCITWPNLANEILHFCCAESNNPAFVFGAQEFVRSLGEGRTHPLFAHKDGILEPVREEPLQLAAVRLGAGIICVRSPARAWYT